MKDDMRGLYLEGILSVPYFLLTQGIVFSSVAIHFGLKGILISVANALPVSFQIFQLVSPYISEKIGSRKSMTLIFIGFSRIVWPLALVILLLMDILDPFQFFIWFAITQMSASMGNSSWISWMRDLIPPDVRGRVLGRRNFFVSISSMIFVYLFTLMIEKLSAGYVLVSSISLVSSALSIYAVYSLEDVPLKRSGFLASLKKVLSDENFMKLVRFFFVWNMVIMSSSAFFGYHLIKVLKVPLSYTGVMSIISGVLLMIFYRIYGEVSDSIGHKSVAEIGIILVSITAMIWLFMDERTFSKLLVIDAILTGLGWSAVNLSLTTLPMEVASGTEQAYFSLYYAMGGVGGILGSVIGGIVGHFLSDRIVHLGDWKLHGLQLMFFFCGLARLSTIVLLDRIDVKRYIPIRRMVFNFLALSARRVPIRPIEYSIGVIRSRLRRLKRREREDEGRQG